MGAGATFVEVEFLPQSNDPPKGLLQVTVRSQETISEGYLAQITEGFAERIAGALSQSGIPVSGNDIELRTVRVPLN
jgi:hypothetical protein